MHIRPLHDRILAKRLSHDELAARPHTDDQLVEAQVIDVGHQAKADGDSSQPALRPGQRVLYLGSKGLSVTLEGEPYVIVRDRAIVAILED